MTCEVAVRHYNKVLIVSPHADDEVLGCGGLVSRLSSTGSDVHVLYCAIDGMKHYGLAVPTTYEQRLAEVEEVSKLLSFTYSIAYGDRGLTERLDTLPKRDLVDLIQDHIDKREPELLLLPSGDDYDQDHAAVFAAGFAAARPIGREFGKWLVSDVMSYEMAKIQWAVKPLGRCAAFADIGDHLLMKLQALKAYATQYRPSPHIRSEESVRALATLRGAEMGVRHAEAFEVHRTAI
ncbi:PIG-L deacetylase family protein [Nonomuraea sp. NPDC049714]|uniref:PIG-L deacetylase family protein n=1 Tax=Nonomuraea sp. NPDC049714 TaxID=3364357 RepID=UPI003797C5DD